MKIPISILITALATSVTSAWELGGGTVTAFTGSSTELKCAITPGENVTTLFHTWKDTQNEMIFFDDKKTSPETRISSSFMETEMTLRISDVKLEDEGEYECSILGMKPNLHETVFLTVNRIPDVSMEKKYDINTYDGETSNVATCIAKGSKPEPEIWFTDSSGLKVDVVGEKTVQTQDDGTVDVELALEKYFYKSDNGQVYNCYVELEGKTVASLETSPINVLYGVSASFSNMKNGDVEVLQESSPFGVQCVTEGNPSPAIQWSFTPDEGINVTMENDLPANFMSNGKELYSDAVDVTSETTTNNGTFTCTVSNGVGDAVSISFRLEVFAAPVTTVPTTPAVTNAPEPEQTPVVELQRGSSDAAVIGGVVAVAVFVLIVALILVVRYFMSHKGTYRTNELKRGGGGDSEDGRGDSTDEHGQMLDDDDLGEKKRKEYFM